MPLEQAVVDAYAATMLRGFTRQNDLADQNGRDTAGLLLFDHRCLSAAIAREIAESPTAQDTMALKTASETPRLADAGAPAPGVPGGGGGAGAGGSGQGGVSGKVA